MAGKTGWTLNHAVVLILAGGFALLLIEVRYLHQEVLREHRIAWAPIVYSGLMLAASLVALPLWDRGGRRALFWAFLPALVIGPTGFWFHNHGQPWQGVKTELAAWSHPVGGAEDAGSQGAGAHGGDHDEGNADEGGPPALAPLAIAGLGLLGMAACARRSQPEPAGTPIASGA